MFPVDLIDQIHIDKFTIVLLYIQYNSLLFKSLYYISRISAIKLHQCNDDYEKTYAIMLHQDADFSKKGITIHYKFWMVWLI